jgi:hypothetical protein
VHRIVIQSAREPQPVVVDTARREAGIFRIATVRLSTLIGDLLVVTASRTVSQPWQRVNSARRSQFAKGRTTRNQSRGISFGPAFTTVVMPSSSRGEALKAPLWIQFKRWIIRGTTLELTRGH